MHIHKHIIILYPIMVLLLLVFNSSCWRMIYPLN